MVNTVRPETFVMAYHKCDMIRAMLMNKDTFEESNKDTFEENNVYNIIELLTLL